MLPPRLPPLSLSIYIYIYDISRLRVNKDNIYCDVKGKICNFLNKFLNEILYSSHGSAQDYKIHMNMETVVFA